MVADAVATACPTARRIRNELQTYNPFTSNVSLMQEDNARPDGTYDGHTNAWTTYMHVIRANQFSIGRIATRRSVICTSFVLYHAAGEGGRSA